MSVICPICDSVAKLKYKLQGTIFKCTSCQLLFAKNIDFDASKIEEINAEDWFENILNLRKKNFEIIIRNIIEIDNMSKGLEVGSSTGLFLEACRNQSILCSGIEPEDRAYAISKEKKLDVVHGFFPQDLPAKNNSYDFIIFNDVFEHIPNIKLNINNINNYLSENGVLILNLPVSTGFFYIIAKIFNFFGYKLPLERLWQFNFYTPHLFYLNKKSMNKLADLNGFEIIKYHKLEVISKEDISYRVNSDRSLKKVSWVIIPIIKSIVPFLNYFKEDIGVFYLRKKARE